MLADPESGTLDDIVDTDRYGLNDPHRSRQLARNFRRQLLQDGAVVLPGFLRAEALDTIGRDLGRAIDHVPIRRHWGTVYARADLEAELAADDPRRAEFEWVAGHVTRDMIPCYSPAHRLYVSAAFKRFVARCVGQQRVFEYADPLAGLVATVLPSNGGRYPWHYDTNEFVVTIMINKPQAGGRFVYAMNLRQPGNENLHGLRDVLDGSDTASLRVTDNSSGDLQIFCGRYSLHQVTAVEGPQSRVVLVLSYADRPGVIGPVDRTRKVYGRVTEAHLVAAENHRAADGLIL